jgi:hypothetical protein
VFVSEGEAKRTETLEGYHEGEGLDEKKTTVSVGGVSLGREQSRDGSTFAQSCGKRHVGLCSCVGRASSCLRSSLRRSCLDDWEVEEPEEELLREESVGETEHADELELGAGAANSSLARRYKWAITYFLNPAWGW